MKKFINLVLTALLTVGILMFTLLILGKLGLTIVAALILFTFWFLALNSIWKLGIKQASTYTPEVKTV